MWHSNTNKTNRSAKSSNTAGQQAGSQKYKEPEYKNIYTGCLCVMFAQEHNIQPLTIEQSN